MEGRDKYLGTFGRPERRLYGPSCGIRRDKQLINEPAFRWWVPFVLKKRERILKKKVKTKYWSVTHKYGLELPKSVAQAMAINKKTGTDFWRKAIEKEIRNVFPAFDFIEDDNAKVPPGYEFVETYFVFDIKMDLSRKARLVARGNMTEATKEQTFASVVSRDTVRLFFLLAALNDLKLLSCDIQNAYLGRTKKRCGLSSLTSSDQSTMGRGQS
jgi:hypothetical protein